MGNFVKTSRKILRKVLEKLQLKNGKILRKLRKALEKSGNLKNVS